jgi:hypothetical protein
LPVVGTWYNGFIYEESNNLRCFTRMFSKLEGICGTTGDIVFNRYGLYGKFSNLVTFRETEDTKYGRHVFVEVDTKNKVISRVSWNVEANAYVYGRYGSVLGWYELTSWPEEIGDKKEFRHKLPDGESVSEDLSFEIECLGFIGVEKSEGYIAEVGIWI